MMSIFFMSVLMPTLHAHVACPCFMSMLHVRAPCALCQCCPCSMSMTLWCTSMLHVHVPMLHAHAACLLYSTLHVHATRRRCLPILLVRAVCPFVCPCRMSMLHVHAAYSCFMSLLHAHASCLYLPAACACWISMLHLHAAWTWSWRCCFKKNMTRKLM